jgi:catechol 2,3-dioxygenase
MSTSTTTTLPAELRLGYVHLTIANLDRSLAFYQNVLGFQLHHRDGNTAYLGAGGDDLLALTEQPNATRARRTTGLYHFAVLVPSRRELAQVIRRVAETRTPAQGASDHLVSEALYLADPDGNGIEIYRDRPRADWPQLNGAVRMDTLPMDVDGVMSELDRQPGDWTGLDAGTVLGHMHLHVRNIPEALTFYRDVLGFDLIMSMDTALFMSAGGYHHHIGLNTWGTLNAPPAPIDSIGLRYFTIQLPDQTAVAEVIARARSVGATIEDHVVGVLVRDPSHNALVFTTTSQGERQSSRADTQVTLPLPANAGRGAN